MNIHNLVMDGTSRRNGQPDVELLGIHKFKVARETEGPPMPLQAAGAKLNSPLHILHLEDDPNDAALVKATLEHGGISCSITRVCDREGFVAALEGGNIDLILSDFSLPAFDGLSAAEIVHEKWRSIPLILVSGSLGEELAIASFKSGATDYILKERLSRLVPAVLRTMLEVQARTEHHRLELQFIEAQKMEVIGHLASGVAHDFNNMLAVIMGYTEMMISDLSGDSPLRKNMERIQHASQRAAALTRQLLIFSRKQTVQAVVLDLNVVVNDTHKMLFRLIDENIEITCLPGEDIGRIKADPGHIGQVLMNLIVNARDAMPNGGKITIQTESITVGQNGAAHETGVPSGPYTLLTISDTGSGMTDQVKAHLFEPFFTTKALGKGTGLGLATCKTIVDQSGGYLHVDSEVGQGTSFKIYFPRVQQSLDYVAAAQSVRSERGTETLLVVEDEPSVRHLAREILEGQGYKVLSSSNGQDALRVAREHTGPPIQLVITDVIMPLMGGKVMVEWLKTVDPHLKILFTSGYTDDTLAPHGVLDPRVNFLPKPYTPGTLTCTVRKMLDNESVACCAPDSGSPLNL